MAVDETRQLADEVVSCVEILAQFCDVLDAREGVEDVERWLTAAGNVAAKAREHLDALRSEVDDWEFSVALCTGGLEIAGDDDDDDDDMLDVWA